MPDIPLNPHADWGDASCCGCITSVDHGDSTDLTCNECGAIIRTVPTADATSVMVEMALSDGYAQAICPHCGSVTLFTGFTELLAYTCTRSRW
jgi:predicted RNA-binding Zn-ribbon protein involved in translation (DUF1610 family)